MKTKLNFLSLQSKILYFTWTLLLLFIYLVVVYSNYAHAEKIALKEAKTSVHKDMAYREWFSSHKGVYIPVSKENLPNPYLSHLKERDIEALGQKFTLTNPAVTLSQVMQKYSQDYGTKTHLTSKQLLNPNNRADEWETVALEKIEQRIGSYYEITQIDNAPYFRLMQPLITQESCLKCHIHQGYSVGEIRGGVSIAIPMTALYHDAFTQSVLLFVLFFILWILGIIVLRFLSQKLKIYMLEKDELYKQYIYALVDILEKRDNYTAGHSSRVAYYAKCIAQTMNLSKDECELVYKAGMLHDIGKVGISDSIFLKASKLNDEEYKRMQDHVLLSYEILRKIPIFDDITEIVRNHHEHYDGSGYPRGLKGDEIPLLSQILSHADTFDAMTSDRVYKNKKSIQESLIEISRFSGKQFNPKIVTATIEALKDIMLESDAHREKHL